MKSSLILSFVFILIGGILAYLQRNELDGFFTLISITVVLIGTGLGLLLGSIIGYSSKTQHVKRKNKAIQQKNTATETITKPEDTSKPNNL